MLKAIVHEMRHPDKRGLLLQIETGEGKSSILALRAAVALLLSYKAHIVIATSNEGLAEFAARQWAPFYNFLGLTVDHTVQKKLSKVYGCHVIYSPLHDFIIHGVNDQFYGSVCFLLALFSLLDN